MATQKIEVVHVHKTAHSKTAVVLLWVILAFVAIVVIGLFLG